MTGFSLDVTQRTIVITSIVQGIGLGLLFVPITTVAFLTLPGDLRNSGASILTLVRNIGSSIGISMVIANLTSKTTEMHARIVEGVTPFNDALQMPDVAANLNVNSDIGRAMLDGIVTQQAAMIAYLNDFKLLMILTLAMIPLVLIIRAARASARRKADRSRGPRDRLIAISPKIPCAPSRYARRAPGPRRSVALLARAQRRRRRHAHRPARRADRDAPQMRMRCSATRNR